MYLPSFLRSGTALFTRARDRRSRRGSTHHGRLTTRLQVEPLEHRWCPSFSLITSRAALGVTDRVDWATLGAAGTVTANPFTVLSGGE